MSKKQEQEEEQLGSSAVNDEVDAAGPDGEDDGAAASSASVEPPSDVEALVKELDEMRLLAQRKQAEFENYRRRVERERMETIKYASAELVREVLPVLDNLERALEADAGGGDPQRFREGVEIIYKQFHDILTKQGLIEVEAENAPFDPHVHEAVGRVEAADVPEDTVVAVLQKGYKFKDRLLRASMVNVASGGESGAPSEPTQDEDENEAAQREN